MKKDKDTLDEYFLKEIHFAKNEINTRNIYHSSLAIMKQVTKHQTGSKNIKRKIGRMSMRLQWLNEFSDIGNEMQSSRLILNGENSSHLVFQNSVLSAQNNSEFDSSSNISSGLPFKKKQTCMVKMVDLAKYEDLLEDFAKREFDILKFTGQVDRR